VAGGANGSVFVYNSSGGLLHSNENVGDSYPYDLEVVDLDNNGGKEIVYGDSDGNLMILNSELSILDNITQTGTATASSTIKKGDINNDGYNEIILGLSGPYPTTNELRVYTAINLTLTQFWSIDLGHSIQYHALDLADVDADGVLDIVAGAHNSNKSILVTKLAGCKILFNDSTLWKSMYYNETTGSYHYNRTFGFSGDCSYNISCSRSFFEEQNTVDSVTVLGSGITIHAPIDNHTTSSSSIEFNWTVTDSVDSSLTCNLTINETVNVTDITVVNGIPYNHTVTDFNDGTYSWNITCWDSNNTYSSKTRIFTTGVDYPPNVTLNYPPNHYSSPNTTVVFNCSATDDNNLVNITLYGNWSLEWHATETKTITGTNNTTTFIKTIDEGSYKWNCLAYDNSSQEGWGTERTFTVATTTTTTSTTTIICDDTPHPCESAYSIGEEIKSGMCGDGQYYKITLTGKCNLTWVVVPDSGSDYDLYTLWNGSCPSESGYNCRPYQSTGLTESCTSNLQQDTYYAMVKKSSGSGAYSIWADLECAITTTTSTSTTSTSTTTVTTTTTPTTTSTSTTISITTTTSTTTTASETTTTPTTTTSTTTIPPPIINHVTVIPEQGNESTLFTVTADVSSHTGIDTVLAVITTSEGVVQLELLEPDYINTYFNPNPGDYEFYVWVNDTMRRSTSTISNPKTFTVLDTTPPSINITPIADVNQSSIITVSATVTDNGLISSVIAEITKPDSAVNVTLTDPDKDTVYEGIFTETSQTGNIQVRVTATDAGNNSAYTYSTFKVLDTEKPRLNSLKVEPLVTRAGTNFTVTADVTDNSAVDSVKGNITKPQGYELLSLEPPNPYFAVFMNSTTKGVYSCYVIANDTSGNTLYSYTQPSGVVNFSVTDYDLPVIHWINLTEEVNASDTVEIIVNVTDSSGILFVYAEVTTPRNNTYTVMLEGTPHRGNFSDTWEAGSYLVDVTAVDLAGNSSSYLTGFTAGDCIAPVINYFVVDQSLTEVNSLLKFYASITDNGVFTAEINITKPNNSTELIEMHPNSVHEANYSPSQPEEYTVLLTARDTGDNTAMAELQFTVFDLTAPQVLNLTVPGLDVIFITDEASNLTLYYSTDAMNWNSSTDDTSLTHTVTLPYTGEVVYYYFSLSDEHGNSARYPPKGFLSHTQKYQIRLNKEWNLISLPIYSIIT